MLLSKNLSALNPRSNTLSGKISSGRSEPFFHFSPSKIFPNAKKKLKLKSRRWLEIETIRDHL